MFQYLVVLLILTAHQCLSNRQRCQHHFGSAKWNQLGQFEFGFPRGTVRKTPDWKPPVQGRPPEDAEYRGDVNTTKNAKPCVQEAKSGTNALDLMSEDCLYLDLFTTKASKNWPVLVYIHGGGYYDGASDLFPDGIVNNYLKNGVIMVSVNYRLNIFVLNFLGFFNSNSSTFPANNGMMDQVKALQWIQANIGRFGGDPKRVTIMGESAGASSVSLLTYSPLARGLFHQSIQESGAAFNPWALNGDSYRFAYNPSFSVSKNLGCSSGEDWDAVNLEDVRACLEAKTTLEIHTASLNYVTPDPFMGIWWAPVVDGKGGFLPDSPENLNSERADINMLMGNNHNEFSSSALEIISNHHDFNPKQFNSTYFDLNLDAMITKEVYGGAMMEIKELLAYNYKTGVSPVNDSNPISWINATSALMSDFFINAGVRKDAAMAKKILNKSKLYLYSFNYVSQNYRWAYYWKAVAHTCELPFVFASYEYGEAIGDFGVGKFDATDEKIAAKFGKMWSNFAISGDPNKPQAIAPVWDAVTFKSDDYMQFYAIDIVSDMKEDYHYSSYNLWELVARFKTQLNPMTTTTDAAGSGVNKLRFNTGVIYLFSIICVILSI